MIIYICDICEEEFKPEKNIMTNQESFSSFIHYYKTAIVSKDNPVPQQKLNVKTFMICSECSEKVYNNVEELKNEKKKTKKSTTKKDM